jgi:hypothetical protein
MVGDSWKCKGCRYVKRAKFIEENLLPGVICNERRVNRVYFSRRSPLRSISPSQGRTRTLEKYVSTGPAGTPSGIPGLEMLDAELQDVSARRLRALLLSFFAWPRSYREKGRLFKFSGLLRPSVSKLADRNGRISVRDKAAGFIIGRTAAPGRDCPNRRFAS